ncbi:SRPBCC domain-containing protein [Flavobacterium sp. JAS]|uniref:SRPBCC family protein n=1 Tax=Flavobacterium sp. JAS TaxID=2897329 RepID=UPI001E395FEF|nr:SRPBCC domain-containing protein [Flavobacterium sp. JAS]MCD0470342.1 SRPBCC domain-containing protein [Flavobacterium sp. JAS]
MQTEIKNEWIYEQSPNEVWEYLTQADLIVLWLMPNNFVPVLGHEFEFRIKPIPSLDLDGIMHCKVLEIVPFQKLVYSWKAGPGNGVISLDTIVEWTLEKYGNGTKLLLKQSGFSKDNVAIFTGMTDGWEKNIQKMISHISGNNNNISK